MDERRIGVYGGTFDPIHNGHAEVARAVTRSFGLDRMLLIPASRPPHKTRQEISDAYHRYAMAVLATIDEPRVLVSTVELEAPDMPYSYQTVGRLRESYGGRAQLFFVIGADSFEEINTWRDPERLLSGANIVVVTRPGSGVAYSHLPARFREAVVDLRGSSNAEDTGGVAGCSKIYLTDYVNMDVSSTDIRRRARGGQSISGMVPARVAEYIQKYGLYKP